MLAQVEIRIARQTDLPEIVAIHNQAIAQPYTNAYTEPFNEGDRTEWFDEHTGDCPIFVAIAGGQIAGWLSISPYRSGRAALAHTKEVSYYVHQGHQKKGIATLLLKHAISRMNDLHTRVYIAVVIDKNTASINLLEKNGFSLWGHLTGVAAFNNEICGHYYYGYRFS